MCMLSASGDYPAEEPHPPEPAKAMVHSLTCLHCKFTVEEDDVGETFSDGRMLCARCAHHQRGDAVQMESRQRRQWEQALNDVTNWNGL